MDQFLKLLKEVIRPHVKEQRQLLYRCTDEKDPVFLDFFAIQMITIVFEAFKEADICNVNVTSNMTKFYQPLDLMVNGSANQFHKRKFNELFSAQVKAQQDDRISNDVV